MTLHFKKSGVWTTVQRPYVKRNGVWTPVQQTWRKSSGAWVKHFEYDVTPPAPPVLTLDLVSQTGGRYINVGVEMPGANDPDVAMIRVLISKTGKPATQYGGDYYTTPDDQFPKEPWSDYYFGPGKSHSDTSNPIYKQWPINHPKGSNVPAGTYYFQAWALDFNGNWSIGSSNHIVVPKTGLGANLFNGSAHFQADYSGTYVDSTGYVMGDLRQTINPSPSRGLFFYGSQFTSIIGAKYGNSHATIQNAQILLNRIDTDGPATSNVYIFRHNLLNPSAITVSPTTYEPVLLGTISKGEQKWFTIPSGYHDSLISGTTRGFGFLYKDPLKATTFAEDYSVLSGVSEGNVRPGELYVVWTEAP